MPDSKTPHRRAATAWHLALVLILAPLSGLVACGEPDSPSEEFTKDGVGSTDATEGSPAVADTPATGPTVHDATVRTVPGGALAAVYLRVENAAGDRLVAVETAAAEGAEAHETVADGDTLRMVARPEGFVVLESGTLLLEPGGKHIMLLEPAFADGASAVDLVLRFERAAAVPVSAELTSADGMDHGGMDHGGMDHGEMDHGGMDHGEGEPR